MNQLAAPNNTINLGYFYPDLLNLYGDNGNVEILKFRAEKMGFVFNVLPFNLGSLPDQSVLSSINLLFMGGGPDSSQKVLYKDLLENKREFLHKYIENSGTGLFVCGAYQLLGKYYKSADGAVLEGLGIFDLYTEHFGNYKPRCIGNTLATLANSIVNDSHFNSKSVFGDKLVGFENHGGRTYLGQGLKPLARVLKGHGNNSEDGSEGCIYKKALGTYFHGPVLSKNPHLADFLLFSALNLPAKESVAKTTALEGADNGIIYTAHTASAKLKK